MKVSNLMIVLIGLVLYGCNNKPNNLSKELNNEEQMEIKAIMSISNKDGLSMLQTNCYSCHNPNSESHDNMLAPPLAGIKYKYKKLYKTEELFIAQMSDFIDKPTKENAVMKGPVRRFGLMPKTSLSKTEIQELVKYIYHTELAIPAWFSEHFEEEHNIKWEER